MIEIYNELFTELKTILEQNNFDTRFFLKSYENEIESKYFYIQPMQDYTLLLFDITVDELEKLELFLNTNPTFKNIKYDIVQYNNKDDQEVGKYKYMVDLTITKNYIRKYKINKLLKR
jgi:hypothetical protein